MLEVKKSNSAVAESSTDMTAGFNVNSIEEFNNLEAEDLNDKTLGWKKITTASKLNIAMTIYSRP